MTEPELFDKICDFLVQQFGVSREKLSRETDLIQDLDADSLELLQIVMQIEDEFGISITDKEAEEAQTIQQWLDLIQKHLKKG